MKVYLIFALLLFGCPKGDCTPNDTRCLNNHPQVCNPSQIWVSVTENCPPETVCCRTRSVYSTETAPREVHACVPPGACIPNN